MLKTIATVKERERELNFKEYSFINSVKKYIKYKDIKIRMEYNLKDEQTLSCTLSFLCAKDKDRR